MTYLIENTMSDGSIGDIDVAAWPTSFLEEILTRQPRKNGILYPDCGQGPNKKDRFRINDKYRPESTQVGIPRELERFRKTSLVRDKGPIRVDIDGRSSGCESARTTGTSRNGGVPGDADTPSEGQGRHRISLHSEGA
jgi:hypothetical protein